MNATCHFFTSSSLVAALCASGSCTVLLSIYVQEDTHFEDRVAEVAKFNEENLWRKRGISITPIR